MGYTTDFDGEFHLDKPLKEEHRLYLEKFSETRRMKRNEFKTALLEDDTRKAVGLPVGEDGCFYVGGEGLRGTHDGGDVVDYNAPPNGQPGLWCQWVPSEDGAAIAWDGSEKFYHYVDWLEYIIDSFLVPWGYVLNGEVSYCGEGSDDRGVICCKDNVVTAVQDKIVNESPFK